MSDKEEFIIQKLVKIASNQQKILAKLAEKGMADPQIIHYLNNGLIDMVAGNLGLPNVKSQITYSPAPDPSVTTTPGNPGTISTEQPDKYFADIFGVPANKRESFSKAIGIQLQNQKPELLGRFSYWFKE